MIYMIATQGLPYVTKDDVKNGASVDDRGFPGVHPTEKLTDRIMQTLDAKGHHMESTDGITSVYRLTSRKHGPIKIKCLA